MSNPPCHDSQMKLEQLMPVVEIQAAKDQGVASLVVLHGTQFASQEEKTLPMKDALSLKASLTIKAAEYWLKLGEADQALRELEALPSRFWSHGWALKTRIAAMGALRERDDITVQA